MIQWFDQIKSTSTALWSGTKHQNYGWIYLYGPQKSSYVNVQHFYRFRSLIKAKYY